MLVITMEVNEPPWLAQAAKENIAMLLEQYTGSQVRVISVKKGFDNLADTRPTQMSIDGFKSTRE